MYRGRHWEEFRMFLGLDAGTSAVKALLVDARQQVVAQATRAYAVSRPEPGWCEQDPADWIAAVEAAIGDLRAAQPAALAAVEAIGLSGQMHSAVLLGRDGTVLRPAMLWNDGRGRAECAMLAAAVPELATITGVQPMPGFTAAKLLWVRAHQPALFARIAHVLLAKDYVRLHLTGEIASDMSDAAGTQLFDQARRCWSPEVLAAVGLDPEVMPRLHEGTEIAGRLRAEVAGRLGLPAGIPVAAGGGDGGTGAVGLGCIDGGAGFISLGTAAVYVVAADRYAPRPETMLHDFAHAIPGRWFQMAGMLNGASALSAMLATLGEDDIDAILARVEAGYRGPSRLLFLPYLSGERTPHNNPDARGVLFGIDPRTDKADIVQAVLEGVAFTIRDAAACLAAADSACPAPGFIGGGARSRLWARIIADATGLTLRRYRGGDFGPALGAARLAIIAATGATLAEVCFPPPVAEEIAPDPALFEAYAPRYARFRELYRAVAPLY
jgi:xylulokinase